VKNWKKLTLVFCGAAVLAACAGLDQLQRQVIFRPNKTVGATPAGEGVPHEDVQLTVAGEKMVGWWIAQRNANAETPAVLYLHGSGFSLHANLPRILRLYEAGFHVLAIDYRGFGASEGGLPSEESAYADARAAWAELQRRAPNAKRTIYGHSLGGAIAVELATHAPDAAALVVESSFTSVREMLPHTSFRWVPLPLVQTQYFDSLTKIRKICAPVLVLHGTNDYRIPTDMAQALYDAAPGPKRIEIVAGARHIDIPTRHFERWRAAIASLRELPRNGACRP
jgi:pimeloyl-ACP methyl ester carboxylesterase